MNSLLNVPLSQWPEIIEGLGGEAYRAAQLIDWIFKKRVFSFKKMSNISQKVREGLEKNYSIRSLMLSGAEESKVDGTTRYFFKTEDGHDVSCVYLPFEHRRSLCLSTQAGCAWGCVFCASGQVKFQRNLTPSEMIDQVFFIEEIVGKPLDSLLFMGMGEPLANYNALVDTLNMVRSPLGLGFGARHVTVSTSGLVPQIEMLAESAPKVNLAISLHAANDPLRKTLLPKSSAWSIKEVLNAAKTYSKKTGATVTFEYVLLGGVNDSEQDAKRLANLIRGLARYGDYWVNLIAYNPVPGLPYVKPEADKVDLFKSILTVRQVPVRVRKPQGVDIGAGCGQLGEAR